MDLVYGDFTLALWALTLFTTPLREVLAVGSTIVVILSYRKLRLAARHAYKILRLHEEKCRFALALYFASCLVFLILASPPVYYGDALTGNLRIISRIVYLGHHDYNVLETVAFGKADLLMHMCGVWLFAFGGTKALTFFVTACWVIGAAPVFYLFSQRCPSPRVASCLLMALYCATPFTMLLSSGFTMTSWCCRSSPPTVYALTVPCSGGRALPQACFCSAAPSSPRQLLLHGHPIACITSSRLIRRHLTHVELRLVVRRLLIGLRCFSSSRGRWPWLCEQRATRVPLRQHQIPEPVFYDQGFHRPL
jgi:hypothetical protein